MDWNRPYSGVAPTLEGDVLAVLWRSERPLTGREVARIARRGSQAGINRALTRLAHQGLLDAQRVGAGILYRLNREHVLAPVVELLATGRERFIALAQREVGQWSIQPRHLSIFGSVARGEGGVDSDVDVLVVRPSRIREDHPPWRSQLEIFTERVLRWTGNQAALSELTPAEISELPTRHPKMYAALKADSVVLAGSPFAQLVKRR